MCLLVAVCALRPDLTRRLSAFLYRGQPQTAYVQQPAAGAVGAAGADAADGTGMADRSGADGTGISDTDGADGVDSAGGSGSGDGAAVGGALSRYVAPSEEELSIPSQVSGINGYRQVEGDARQVDEHTAAALEDSLDVGETGDDYSFDAVFYPYYHMLDDAQQHVYRQVYANAGALCLSFRPVEDLTPARLKSVFEAVYNDHPELFWLETAYVCKYTETGRCVEIDLRTNRTARDLEASQAAFAEQADAILSQARNMSSDYAKEKYVHDRLLDAVSYYTGAEMNQSAYSALVEGRTVCAGYARSFQYILQQLGIPCYYCTGYAGESHAWNIVVLDDGCYNVDVTWDDAGGGAYDYFNKTDADYAGTHIRQELSVNLPPCEGQAYRGPEQSEESGGSGNNTGSGDTESGRNGNSGGTDNGGSGAGSSSGTGSDRKGSGGSGNNSAGTGGSENDSAGTDNSGTGTESSGGRMRSLEDTGFGDASVFTDMDSYYADCYSQIIQNGLGRYSFYNVIEGSGLFGEWEDAYDHDGYKQAYMDEAMEQVGAYHCSMGLVVEKLQDDKYLIRHDVTLTE